MAVLTFIKDENPMKHVHPMWYVKQNKVVNGVNSVPAIRRSSQRVAMEDEVVQTGVESIAEVVKNFMLTK